MIFPEYFAEFAGGLLQNGMTAGGLVAILMTLFVEVTAPRPQGVVSPGEREAASRGGWWRWLDLNQRRRGYEPRALTN